MKWNVKRSLVYLLGHWVLAAGIVLMTKVKLGVSPVSSFPYALSEILGLPFSWMNFVVLCVMIGIQVILLGKAFRLSQLSQILANGLSSLFIDLIGQLVPLYEDLWVRFLVLIVAIVLIGIGASLTVGMKLAPSPADALADTIGQVTGRGFGFGKNLLDVTMIGLAALLSFLLTGHLIGIGLGTALAMVLTGRVIAVCHPYTTRLYEKIS